MRSMGWLRYTAGVVFTVLVVLGPARAADLNIAAFYGQWQGNAVSESAISLYFQLTSRDIGVTVQPSGDGFTLTWNTVQRQKGDPNNPAEELKSTTVQFRPERPGVWRSVDTRDPLTGGAPYIWAHIRERTLVVNALQINPDGGYEIQVYRRTLSGAGMELEFVRVVDGEPVRTAKGRLIKVAN